MTYSWGLVILGLWIHWLPANLLPPIAHKVNIRLRQVLVGLVHIIIKLLFTFQSPVNKMQDVPVMRGPRASL
jgi:hypothetical protein